MLGEFSPFLGDLPYIYKHCSTSPLAVQTQLDLVRNSALQSPQSSAVEIRLACPTIDATRRCSTASGLPWRSTINHSQPWDSGPVSNPMILRLVRAPTTQRVAGSECFYLNPSTNVVYIPRLSRCRRGRVTFCLYQESRIVCIHATSSSNTLHTQPSNLGIPTSQSIPRPRNHHPTSISTNSYMGLTLSALYHSLNPKPAPQNPPPYSQSPNIPIHISLPPTFRMPLPFLSTTFLTKSRPHSLRSLPLLTFPPAFLILLLHGVLFARVNPAIGILPLFSSALYSAFLLANEKPCGCNYSGLSGTAIHLVVDLLLGIANLACLILAWVFLAESNGCYEDNGAVLGAYGTNFLILNLCVSPLPYPFLPTAT